MTAGSFWPSVYRKVDSVGVCSTVAPGHAKSETFSPVRSMTVRVLLAVRLQTV